jgi:Heparinase II/III-like protein.
MTIKEELFKNSEKFFGYDYAKCAEYAKQNLAVDVKKTIETADDVVNKSFLFDMRWDMERTRIPVVFKGEIDWLYMPSDDPEFIFAFNRMRFWITLGQAYVLTNDEKYAKAFVSQMTGWVRKVQKSDKKNEKAWRTIEAGLRMEYWSKAIVYFKDSPNLTEDAIQLFADSLTEHSEYILSVWNTYNLLSNWGVLANHGLFVASQLLPQTDRTRLYAKTAIERMEKEISIGIYDDGVEWEQSSMYHNEVLHDYLDVLILAKLNKDIKLSPFFVERVKKMAYASAAWQKPNGTEPMLGDSDEIDQRDLLEKAAYVFEDGYLKAHGDEKLSFDALWDIGTKGLEGYQKLQEKPAENKLFVLKDSGNAIYKNDGTYLRFKNGTLGAGHGHADQLAFDLFAKGEDILIDPGRFTYVDKPERYEFKDSYAHNTLTIDGKNSYVAKDSWEYSKMSRAFGFKANEKNGFCYLEGGHLGYYREGIFVARKIIALDKNTFVVADEVFAPDSDEHSVESHFHFSSTGSVEITGYKITYSGNEVKAYITCYNSKEIKTEITRMSRHYNESEENVSVTVARSGKGFQSLLFVITIDEDTKTEKLLCHSNFKDTIFRDEEIEALAVGDRIVAVSHYEWGSPTDSVCINGKTGWGQTIVFDKTDDEIGTVLDY